MKLGCRWNYHKWQGLLRDCKTGGSFTALILRDAATSWDLGTKAGCSCYQSVVIGRCTGTNWIVINWMDTALIASISICQSTHPLHGGLAGGESGYFQCRNRTAAGYIQHWQIKCDLLLLIELWNQMWSLSICIFYGLFTTVSIPIASCHHPSCFTITSTQTINNE